MAWAKIWAMALLVLMLAGCAHQQGARDSGTGKPKNGSGNVPLTLLDGQDLYHVNMFHQVKVGDAYHVDSVMDIDVTMSMTTARNGGTPKSDREKQKFELIGRIDVAELDGNGSPKAIRVTVEKFQGPGAKDLVEAGKVVDIKRTWTGVDCTVRGGGKLPDNALTQLRGLLEKTDSTGMMGQAQAGARIGDGKPLTVGDIWPLAMKDMPGLQVGAELKDAKGHVQLKSLERVAGRKVLPIEMMLSAKMKMKGLPFGFSLDDSDIKMNATIAVEVEHEEGPVETKMEIEMHFVVSGSVLFIPMKIDTTMHMNEVMTAIAKDEQVEGK